MLPKMKGAGTLISSEGQVGRISPQFRRSQLPGIYADLKDLHLHHHDRDTRLVVAESIRR